MSEDQPPIITVPVSDAEHSLDANGALGLEVSKLFADAARGDLTAQRRLRDDCVTAVIQNHEHVPNHDLLALYAIFAARLAAAQGGYIDLQRLAATLLGAGALFGNRQREGIARSFACEALALFERMAEEGDADASATADQIVGMHPDLVRGAKYIMAKDTAE